MAVLRPEKRFYPSTQSTMTEASIDSGFTRDLYVSLGEPIAGTGAWIVRVYYKPFVGLDLGRLLRDGVRRPESRRATRRISRQGEAIGNGARRRHRGDMKRLWFLIPLACFFALAAILARGLRLDPHEVPSPLIDKPAPAFALTRLDDAAQTIRLQDMRGKVWMLNVWASWCVSCREEHPLLLAFSKKHLVPIYGLDYKDQRVDASSWLSRFGNPYDASLFDGEGRTGIDFGVYGRARNLHHRPGRRHPHEAHRPAHRRRARDQDRALPREAEEARCLRAACARCLSCDVGSLDGRKRWRPSSSRWPASPPWRRTPHPKRPIRRSKRA